MKEIQFPDMGDVTTTAILTFVGEPLEVSIEDRTDPIFILFLTQIEHTELYKGDGLLWYKHLKDNYGIKFGDRKTETRIENILIANKRQGITTKSSPLKS